MTAHILARPQARQTHSTRNKEYHGRASGIVLRLVAALFSCGSRRDSAEVAKRDGSCISHKFISHICGRVKISFDRRLVL